MQEVNVQRFRNNGIYKGVNAVIQSDKTFRNTTVLPWKEEFTDSKEQECISLQVEVPYNIQVDDIEIRESIFTKIVCKAGVRDAVEKMKLKPGDRIRFTGKYSARRGNVRWFTSFEVLHPSFIEKVGKSDKNAI